MGADYSNDSWSLLGIFSHASTSMVHSYDGDWGNNAFWEDTTTYGFDPYYYRYYSHINFLTRHPEVEYLQQWKPV